jgi:hypothetical protein
LLLLLLPQKIAKMATKTELAVSSSSLSFGHGSMRCAHGAEQYRQLTSLLLVRANSAASCNWCWCWCWCCCCCDVSGSGLRPLCCALGMPAAATSGKGPSTGLQYFAGRLLNSMMYDIKLPSEVFYTELPACR